jgi:hypothetical protein
MTLPYFIEVAGFQACMPKSVAPHDVDLCSLETIYKYCKSSKLTPTVDQCTYMPDVSGLDAQETLRAV